MTIFHFIHSDPLWENILAILRYFPRILSVRSAWICSSVCHFSGTLFHLFKHFNQLIYFKKIQKYLRIIEFKNSYYLFKNTVLFEVVYLKISKSQISLHKNSIFFLNRSEAIIGIKNSKNLKHILISICVSAFIALVWSFVSFSSWLNQSINDSMWFVLLNGKKLHRWVIIHSQPFSCIFCQYSCFCIKIQ